MYDLVKWFVMPLSSEVGGGAGRDTSHLEGLNLTNGSKVYAYHYDSGKTLVFTKTPQGFPWDGKPYDENFIYDSFTELDWKSPKNFKKMISPIPMCPRYWNGDETIFQFSTHATYNEYTSCLKGKPGDVGPVKFTLKGPFKKDFLGDIGNQDTILLSYYWGDMKHREQLFLTERYGWIDWTHAVLTQLSANIQDYEIDSSVTHNKIVKGTLIPQVPCFQI